MSAIITKTELQCYDPSTGKPFETVKISTSEQTENILKNSKIASKIYSEYSYNKRRKLVNDFRKIIVKNQDEFIDIICKETGKKPFEALMEIMVSVELMKTQARHGGKILKSKKLGTGIYLHKKGFVEFRPYGVVGIISPWNYPLILTLSPLTESLLTGNAVVLKPSEQTPVTALLLKKYFDSIADDENIFQVVCGATETGKIIVESKYTDLICFTGSTTVGKIIAKSCGAQLKPCILELGGKDAMMVLEDANLSRAIKACVWGGFSNAGQTCISVERVYLSETIYDNFIDSLKLELKHLSSGPNSNNLIGAMTMKSGLEKVNAQIEEVRNLGTTIISYNTSNEPLNGQFIQPTIIINPPNYSDINNKETFGPVITIHKISDEKDGITKINSSEFGLSASVFTKNFHRGKKIAQQIEAGMVCVNDALVGYALPNFPFGGFKNSGLGRVHGKEGLLAFCQPVSIIGNRITLPKEIWWFDLSTRFYKIMKRFIRFWYG